MKYLIFATVLFISASYTSCNSNANAESSKDDAVTENAASSSSTGDAVFSYNLDGVKVSGGEVDDRQRNNAAEIYQYDANDKQLRFLLNDDEQKNTDIVAHSMLFAIPYKTGTVNLTPDKQNNWNVQLFLPSGQAAGSRLAYGQESFRITLINISSTRISGTFSGTMKKSDADKSSAKDEITITDGKFDIPIRDNN